MEEKRYWQNSEPYHLVEVMLEADRVIFKDWFDSGKDPNRYDWSLNEFLTGEGKSQIEYFLSHSIYNEILEAVKYRLMKR